MKRFSFRLDSVLNLRRNQEKQAQRNLYRARKEYALKEETIGQMKERKQEIDHLRRRQALEGIHVSLHHIYRSFLNGTDRQLEEAHAELEEIGEKVKDRISTLRGASVRKKSLELLRAGKEKVYLDNLEKETQKASDELTLIRRGHDK